MTAQVNDFAHMRFIPNGCGSHRIAEQQTFLCKVRESVLALNKSRGCADCVNRARTDTLKACCTDHASGMHRRSLPTHWAGGRARLETLEDPRSPPERPRRVSCSCLQRKFSGAFCNRCWHRVCKAEVPRDRKSKTASVNSKRAVKSARRKQRQSFRNRYCHVFTETHTRKWGIQCRARDQEEL